MTPEPRERSRMAAATGAARDLAATLTTLATEEVVEEVFHAAAAVVALRRRRSCSAAPAHVLDGDSVLMLTTLGSNCLAICENAFDSCCGEGTVSGVASLFCLSLPLTPYEMTVPIRMPSESVARILNV